MHTDFVLDALEQAPYARQPEWDDALIHHSDRGWQHVPIRRSERLAEAGIEPSVGSKGDSQDNALAETINGLYKAELIHRQGPWPRCLQLAAALRALLWVEVDHALGLALRGLRLLRGRLGLLADFARQARFCSGRMSMRLQLAANLNSRKTRHQMSTAATAEQRWP